MRQRLILLATLGFAFAASPAMAGMIKINLTALDPVAFPQMSGMDQITGPYANFTISSQTTVTPNMGATIDSGVSQLALNNASWNVSSGGPMLPAQITVRSATFRNPSTLNPSGHNIGYSTGTPVGTNQLMRFESAAQFFELTIGTASQTSTVRLQTSFPVDGMGNSTAAFGSIGQVGKNGGGGSLDFTSNFVTVLGKPGVFLICDQPFETALLSMALDADLNLQSGLHVAQSPNIAFLLTGTENFEAVPEPSSALLVLVAAAFGAWRRGRRRLLPQR